MKKISIVLLALAALFNFASCGSDDDDYNKSDILGVWHNGAVYLEIQTGSKELDNNEAVKNWFYNEFAQASDATYTFFENDIFTEMDSDGDIDEGTYAVKGRKLFLTYIYLGQIDNEETLNMKISNNQNQLALSGEGLLDKNDLNEEINIPGIQFTKDVKIKITLILDKKNYQ